MTVMDDVLGRRVRDGFAGRRRGQHTAPVGRSTVLGQAGYGSAVWRLARYCMLAYKFPVCKHGPVTNPPSTTSVLSPVGRVRTRARTSDRVYDELVTAIRELRIPPGASLSETDLAEQLHVSRTPLREAIARLVDNGLVSVVPQVGTRVERIHLPDVEQAWFVREALEVAAFATVCSQEARDVAELRSLLEQQKRANLAHDFNAFFELDEALHQHIFQMSGYPGAWSAMQPMKLQLDRLRRLSLPDPHTIDALIAEHTAIVDSIESGSLESGTDHIRRHAQRVLAYGPALRDEHPELFTS